MYPVVSMLSGIHVEWLRCAVVAVRVTCVDLVALHLSARRTLPNSTRAPHGPVCPDGKQEKGVNDHAHGRRRSQVPDRQGTESPNSFCAADIRGGGGG